MLPLQFLTADSLLSVVVCHPSCQGIVSAYPACVICAVFAACTCEAMGLDRELAGD